MKLTKEQRKEAAIKARENRISIKVFESMVRRFSYAVVECDSKTISKIKLNCQQ